ncbi:beta-fructofuranosidase suc2 [Turnera subulata]|uniref:Beta-fructofuranosidase suc2 n=1 Tax=Turnera subulata TaxID=218843 RepID=A0A9Q0F0Z9_9ROSI|nr:beta-fructofuranosidase suc2 [Turnera subulata]
MEIDTRKGDDEENQQQQTSMVKIIMITSIACGVQFGWALQLSLLTPYVQLLGVPHTWSGFIWLCGPLAGMIVQPIVGYYSDRCTSRYGRRSPFICVGAISVVLAVILIGFAADIGYAAGDSLTKTPKTRAVVCFVVGFWVLDVANNMIQGPCRALLADMCGSNLRMTRASNSLFSFFMAVGNVLGYAAGSIKGLHKMLPFTETDACDNFCANLKTCFLISVVLLFILTTLALLSAKEKPWTREEVANEEDGGIFNFFKEIYGAFRQLNKPMWILLLTTSVNWIGWFPFLLYDTDWMAREVYGGDPDGVKNLRDLYDNGVRAGSIGLLLLSVFLGAMSLGVEGSSRLIGVKKVWGIVNIFMAFVMAMTCLVTKMAEHHRDYVTVNGVPTLRPPDQSVKISALAIFAALGIPQAITYSIPFALASIFSAHSGAGQGLSLGVLNVSICVPQIIVSVISGPLDAAFGGGNMPAFVMSAIAALVSGIMAMTILPRPPMDIAIKATPSGGH